jgi:hypothetical protein
VVVEGVDGRRNADGRLANGWKVADVKAIEAYLASPAPGTVLALVAEELKKDAPLTKAARSRARCSRTTSRSGTSTSGSPSAFSRRARAPSPMPCAALIQLVGEDFHQLANEIDKLALWAGDEPIGEQSRGCSSPAVAEAPRVALTDAWTQRDTGRTARGGETIFEREGRPRRDTAPRLAGALVTICPFMAPLPAARGRRGCGLAMPRRP